MLKITVENMGEMTKFKLEGKLTGPWVPELERSWTEAGKDCAGACVTVDLSDVTFVDAEGRGLLSRMCRQGVHFQASGVMNKSIIEQIQQAASVRDGNSD